MTYIIRIFMKYEYKIGCGLVVAFSVLPRLSENELFDP